jgi:hypothetical protein
MEKQEFQAKLYEALEAAEGLPTEAKDFIRHYLHIDCALEVITPRGKGQSIKTGKPTKHSPIYAYIWRMARFNSGADLTLPVMASFDLQDGLGEICPSFRTGENRDRTPEQREADRKVGKVAADLLDALSMVCVKLVKGDALAGAKRWHKAIYG